jgi:hypothetical protein
MLNLERYKAVHEDPEEKGKKCILLKPEIKIGRVSFSIRILMNLADNIWTDSKQGWSRSLIDLEENKEVGLFPYTVKLDYDYYTYRTHIIQD